MKISKFTNSIPLFILLVLILVGCNDKPFEEPIPVKENLSLEVNDINSKNITGWLREIKFKNHEYLIYDSGNGKAIIHSESCPCKNKN